MQVDFLIIKISVHNIVTEQGSREEKEKTELGVFCVEFNPAGMLTGTPTD